MKKVVAKYRKPFCCHAIGFCNNCDEQFDIFHGEMPQIKKHILKTGHSVAVEYGLHNTFYLRRGYE